MMQKNNNQSDIRKRFVLGAFLFLVFFLSYSAVTLVASIIQSDGSGGVEGYAKEILKVCAESNYAPTCYDEEVPKLLQRGISMEEAFEVTALIQKEDPRYYYCHVLGHNLSAKEAAKDLSQWTDVVARCPVGQCSNGCLHGAFQERFRDENVSSEELGVLKPKLKTICEDTATRTFTELERTSCYHAIGHLTMYIHDADAKASVNLCDSVVTRSEPYEFVRNCYDGVFMQIFQPLEPEDIALIADRAPRTQTEARDFCAQFDRIPRESCNSESWPLFLEDIKTIKGMDRFCGVYTTERGIQGCYNTIFYVLTAHFEFNQDRLEAICLGLSDERMAQCYANISSRFLEIDDDFLEQSIEFCERAEKTGVGKRCWDELLFYSSFSTVPGTERFEHFCGLLPHSYKERCQAGEGSNLSIFDL
ncbi:MAG: hypothetical protein ACJKTH_03865 [Patescibacteria group bacterium UBA2163]